MKGQWKKLGRLFKIIALLYIGVGVVLYFIQDLLLFHPTPLPNNHHFAFSQPFKEQNIALGSRNLNIIKFTTHSHKKGIVLYFHGNMRNVERYAPFAELFTKNGFEVWMMDYPGFGKSTGKLTEVTLYNDAAILYNMALNKVAARNLIIYGKSLGTGVAAQLAATHKCQQLILETAYYSIPEVAKSKFPFYPVQWLVKYSFPTHRFLSKVTSPVTLFHGTSDAVVPYLQAMTLRKENPSINLISFVNGKHNNLSSFPLYEKEMIRLLSNKLPSSF